ncbi:MAG: TrpB-like pyridoxal phosphate-dependent enzyme [Neisseriaceae bacterium]|nr:TrpB-like pyridoxal phosphate-dependent enzyme [Neisseriaceae bacterium]
MSKNISENIPTEWCNFLYDHPEFVINERMTSKSSEKNLLKHVNIAPKQPLSLMKQSYNTDDAYINIPHEIWQQYQSYRPTPLRRAFNLEKRLNCNAHIYYKYEGANASGSHKLNTAIAQVYYYKKAGVKHIVTGTGAGQWGTAIAYACKLFDLKCTVFMVNISLNQKPQRRELMESLGATVYSSPTNLTEVGRKTLLVDNKHPGSLAVATAEAIEVAGKEPYTQFSVGSGENCVLLHQTIIGQEALEQMQSYNEFPDQVIACMGAGSNFGGITLPFYRYAKLHKKNCLLVAAEPNACPKLTRGKYAFEINDFSGSTPI